MTRKNGRRLGPAVALVTAIGLTSACGDATEPTGAAGKPENATSTAAGKPAQRTEPLTAAELKPALLTPEQVVGFEITGSSARDGAAEEPSYDAEETVSPEACQQVRDATRGDDKETAAAQSTMYRGKSTLGAQEYQPAELYGGGRPHPHDATARGPPVMRPFPRDQRVRQVLPRERGAERSRPRGRSPAVPHAVADG
ncbi:hypothetical protein RB201_01920 [Streptomyces sp. S1A(2023)]